MTVRICIFLLIIVSFCFSQIKTFTLAYQSNGVSKTAWGFDHGVPMIAVQTPERYSDNVSTFKLQAFDWTSQNRLWVKDMGLPNDEIDGGSVWNTCIIFADLNSDSTDEIYIRQKVDNVVYLVGYHFASNTEICRIQWPNTIAYRDAHMLSVAYLDGVESNPSLILTNKTYGAVEVYAYDLISNAFVLRWNVVGRGDGTGGHGIWCGDYDLDSYDEILIGDNLLDSDGSLLWTLNLGHVDFMIPCELLKNSPGPEFVFGVCELLPGFTQKGVYVCNNEGELIWSYDQNDYPSMVDFHGGWAANLFHDWHPEICCHCKNLDGSSTYFVFDSSGTVISNQLTSNNWPIYWNTDFTSEYAIHTGSGETRIDVRQYFPPNSPVTIYQVNGDAIPEHMDLIGDQRDELLIGKQNTLEIYQNSDSGEPTFLNGRMNRNYYMMSKMSACGYLDEWTAFDFGPAAPSFMDTVYQCMSDSLPNFAVSGHVGLTISISKVIPYNFTCEVVWSYDCASFIQEIRDKYAFFLNSKIAECDSAILEWQDKKDDYLYELYIF